MTSKLVSSVPEITSWLHRDPHGQAHTHTSLGEFSRNRISDGNSSYDHTTFNAPRNLPLITKSPLSSVEPSFWDFSSPGSQYRLDSGHGFRRYSAQPTSTTAGERSSDDEDSSEQVGSEVNGFGLDSGDNYGLWSGENGFNVCSGEQKGSEREGKRPLKRKRRLSENFAEDHCEHDSCSEDENEDGGEKRRQGQKLGDVGSRSYSCPYYKYDPEKHPKCALRRFPAPRRVKSHVLRTHLQPVQCPRRCGYRDGTNALVWKHLENTDCKKGISEKLPDEIVQKGKKLDVRGISWAHIWITLFGGTRTQVPVPDFGAKDGRNLSNPEPGETPTYDLTPDGQYSAPESPYDGKQSANIQQAKECMHQVTEGLQKLVKCFEGANVQSQLPATQISLEHSPGQSAERHGHHATTPSSLDISHVQQLSHQLSIVSHLAAKFASPEQHSLNNISATNEVDYPSDQLTANNSTFPIPSDMVTNTRGKTHHQPPHSSSSPEQRTGPMFRPHSAIPDSIDDLLAQLTNINDRISYPGFEWPPESGLQEFPRQPFYTTEAEQSVGSDQLLGQYMGYGAAPYANGYAQLDWSAETAAHSYAPTYQTTPYWNTFPGAGPTPPS